MDPINDPNRILRPPAAPPAAKPGAGAEPAAPAAPAQPAAPQVAGDALRTAGGPAGPDHVAAALQGAQGAGGDLGALLEKRRAGGPAGAEGPGDDPVALAGHPGLDEVDPGKRAESFMKLAGRGAVTGAERAALGALAASLARTSAQGLPPGVVALLGGSATASRAFMQGLRGPTPAQRAKLLGKLPVNARKRLFDDLGTDGEDLELTSELVHSLLDHDPELAGEALDWGGEALARAILDRLDDEARANLPPEAKAAIARLLGAPLTFA